MNQLVTRYLVKNRCIAVSEKPFKLKSGRTSRYYVDVRSIISDPDAFNLVTKLLTVSVKEENCEVLCGVPHGAEPYVAVIANALGVPMIKVRKEIKDYGLNRTIEGKFTPGQKCVLIEDVTSTGESVIETVKKMEMAGLKVVKILSVVDRCFGAGERIRCELGIEMESLVELSEESLCRVVNGPVYRLYEIMREKGSKLCLSADYTDSMELLEMVRCVGSSIVILKIHADMIKDLDDETLCELVRLKKEYNFLIMEDRKYGDIAKTVVRQIRNGVLEVLNWADMVTIHGFVGETTLQKVFMELSDTNLGFVVINEMSNVGSLYHPTVDKFPSLVLHNAMQMVGMVGSKRVKHTLMMKPGISLNVELKVDGDQTYKHPLKVDTDVWIVGADIINHDKKEGGPLKRVNEYNNLKEIGNGDVVI